MHRGGFLAQDRNNYQRTIAGRGSAATGPIEAGQASFRILARIIHERFYCNRGSVALAREAAFLTRRSYLVSRRSQALIFLLARYASRFTNDGLLEIRFTRNALSGDFVTNRHE